MRRVILPICLLFVVVICHTSILGTFYMDQNHPSASDENSGSTGSLWLTILHAMTSANPTDIIVVSYPIICINNRVMPIKNAMD